MNTFHQPVLLKETIEGLNLQSNDNVIDCTVGGGGHALEILKKISPHGKLLAIDLDPLAIQAARTNLKNYLSRITFIEDNFKNINKIKKDVFNPVKIHAILCDLGLSSAQLQDRSRGFSFRHQESFDLRFGPGSGSLTAEQIINTYKEQDLKRIFQDYSEEKLASKIAQRIIAVRHEHKIKMPAELAAIIVDIYKRKFKTKSKIHPATKVFQALRMEVNQELVNLQKFLPPALSLLEKAGRLAVISFHGLEERIIKKFIRRELGECICPPKAPVCLCHHQATLKMITKKPVKPSEQEVQNNPRSRSAKLWLVQKI
jgi:16S rRNA (cytosine1402-N4)-methyltransferase